MLQISSVFSFPFYLVLFFTFTTLIPNALHGQLIFVLHFAVVKETDSSSTQLMGIQKQQTDRTEQDDGDLISSRSCRMPSLLGM